MLAAAFRHRKRPLGGSWCAGETYVEVRGAWKYLYRTVDRDGQTVGFLLTAKQDLAAARCSFERAIDRHDLPVTIDERGASTATIPSALADAGTRILLRQSRYMNNTVGQDHRATKQIQITRPMLAFKSLRCTRAIIMGVETMQMIRKGQTVCLERAATSAAQQFRSLAS